jgi:RNA polymerase sigma-70 factor, ECF subfamily
VQDVFLALFEQQAQFAGRSAFTTYLYSATTNACLKRITRQKNRRRLIEQHFSVSEREGDTKLSQERLYILHEHLARMPERLARVVVYVHMDELTHEEIGQLIGCSRRLVGKLLERAESWIRTHEERAW